MNSTLFKIWRGLCAWTLFLWFWTRFYKLKSMLHRALFDRKFKAVVPTFQTLQELGAKMANYPYRLDGPLELWDAACTPEKVQYVLENGLMSTGGLHGNDCDEMGIWQLAAMQKSHVPPVVESWLFTVLWMHPETSKMDGHNLTMMKMSDGRYQAMSYGLMSPRSDNMEDLVIWCIRLYDRTAVPFFWALSDLSLSPKLLRRVCS